jgi:hypothetical protein
MPKIEFPLQRTYDLKALFYVTTSIGIALAAQRFISFYGTLFLACVVLFWIGQALLMISDWIDPRAIDEKRIVGKVLNLMGILAIGIGAAVAWGLLMIGTMYGIWAVTNSLM